MSNFSLSSKFDKNKVFIIKKNELDKRLDPFYYVPELVELENKVLDKKPKRLRDYVLSMGSGATPKTTESELYYSDAENGVPFLRVQNLSPTGVLEFEDCKYINQETHTGMLKRSQVFENDLLIKITGVGRMAVASVAPEGFEGNINQHIVVVKTESKEISETVAAFLNSDIGERLASRRSTGGTRPALDYPALLSIPIIYDSEILEIVKKVVEIKKANEAKAEELLSGIDDYLLKELGIKLPEPPDNTLSNRIFYSTIKNLSGQRFDPKLYSPYTIALLDCVQHGKFKHVPLRNLIIHSAPGDWGIDGGDSINEDLHYKCIVIRATEFDNKFNLNLSNDRVKYRYISKQKLNELDIQENDLLIEKSGGSENQPVGRIAILEKELFNNGQLGYSNFVHKIRLSKEILPQFAFNYLKTLHNIKITDILQSQTNGIRNLILSQYFNLPIPIPSPDKQHEISNYIDGIKKNAKELYEQTDIELNKASEEIEKIILS
ncbi:MAG: hypothetical protein CVU00_04695 [Bacteroidetes bacterium HGW-Bacteroidetes-17]|jgi:restriction endonuclease S subunit|nr:MAG: hypothetical protein CVU00_04695 [Bacteroidetes bacterium HGW-Bacteroidetes-17]